MILAILLALLPLAAFAQYEFDPVRLDDGVDLSYFYPWFVAREDGNLFCAWAGTSETRIAGAGRAVSPAGTPMGETRYFQVVDPGHMGIVCPPEVEVLPHADGGEAQFIFHA